MLFAEKNFTFQVFSYGGFLKYSVFYDVVVNSSPYRAADVIIRVGIGLL